MTDPRKVNATCEYLLKWDKYRPEFCGEPTAFWYPAQGGGTMALCSHHAIPHQRNADAAGLKHYEAPR